VSAPLRTLLATSAALTVLFAAAGPADAIKASDFKRATGKDRTALIRIAKARDISHIYAVLVAKQPRNGVRYGIACGEPAPRGQYGFSTARHRHGKPWRGYAPSASGRMQYYDVCFAWSPGEN
jgi:hypothetical protein